MQSSIVLTPERLTFIRTAFENNPFISIQRVSTALNMPQTIVDLATKLLKLHLYRVNIVQEILPTDCPKRIKFCNQILKFVNDAGQFDYFHISYEAWFTLDGSKNYRVWSCDNPSAYTDTSPNSPKIVVWYAMSRCRIIGPNFFNTAVNSDVYCDIICQFISLLELDDRYNQISTRQSQSPCIKSNHEILYRHFFEMFQKVYGHHEVWISPHWNIER